MQFLTKFSLKNVAAVMIIAVLLMGGGVYSFLALKSDLLPDIEFPQLSVTAVYPGASAEDVDRRVTSPLEEQLKGVEGLSSMTSQSLSSVSRIQLSFPIGTDMDKTTRDVEGLLQNAGLPEEVETPTASRFSFSSVPVLNLALFTNGEQADALAEQWVQEVLKPELERIEGINSVALSAVPQQYLEIVVDQSGAARAGITLQTIKDNIDNAFFSYPAGALQSDEVVVPVHVEQELQTLEALEALVIPSNTGGAGVRLSELATVRPLEEKSELARYNTKDSMALLINKKQNANTVDVADRVIETLDSYEDHIQYVMIFDQAEAIESSINELVSKGLFGALFAALTVLIFLRSFRATFIAVLSIPLSLLIAAIFIKWWGFTLNVMSLAGMTVAVGRVVDDSIIVIENIYRKRKLEPQADRTEMTREGTREMMSAILSSTLTTVVVFLPLGLVGGITGAFFLPFALTVVVALLASLLVSITVVPVLARSSFVKLHEQSREPFYIRVYERIIRFALRRKALVLLTALVLLIGSGVLYQFSNVGFVFLPNEKQKIISATVELPPSATLERTGEVSQAIEQQLEQEKETYPKRFASIGSFDIATGSAQPNRAVYYIELAEDADMEVQLAAVDRDIAAILEEQAPGSTWRVEEQASGGPPTNNNVDIDLFSDDPAQLEAASAQVEELMLGRDDLKSVTNNMQAKQQQWSVKLSDDKMKAAGLSSFMVLGTITDRTQPVEGGELLFDGDNREVRLTYDEALAGKSALEQLTLFGPQGPVQLSEVADIEQVDVYTSVQKLNERVYARVSGQVQGNDVRAVTAEVTEAVQQLDLPDGVSLESGGGSDETVQTFVDIGIAMIVAIGLVYLTMLIFFGQARVPFIIMSSLLFVPIGALVGLVLAREPLSMSAMIGLLMLIGIVVTNAIVLVDRINQNRRLGLTIHEALIESGKTRLRPILMTALATIAALLPLVFSTPEGGLISRGLAVVVVGGLTTSTLLTVIFLPVVYELAFRKQHRQEQQREHSA
ncbi:efflux RND transporter permease subunit [Paenibacillus sp. IB182496]|uniref:Efflux RND transporter permease subunit n=1 Tax=Paenibacillus sabuli TaxID=2772509 RepID=A0A927BSM2_9BACL|nr:efflux RND transporter permease subunit [Paenibacillus sabuli]MBD2846026.1 efflux RND transporter permease subunit [Paenibacillus sabuli]